MSKSVASFPRDPSALFLRLLRRLRLGDYLVAFLFIVLACGSMIWERIFFPGSATARASHARILVRHAIIAELDLQRADTVIVHGALGAVTLATAEGNIRVLSSSCANRICVRQGAIHAPHQMLVCAPNHLAVLLFGARKNDLDAVTF